MKKTLCLLLMLFTFTCTYAKKEYIQLCPPSVTAGTLLHISGALPTQLKEKLEGDEYTKITKKELEKILERKIDFHFPDTYMGFFLNYLADFGFELQQALPNSDGRTTYILVRDTEEKKD